MRLLCSNVKEIITDISYLLVQLSEGNFRIDSACPNQYIGEYAPILIAVCQIRDNLSSTIRSIDEAAEQVATGASQLSDGSQLLAEILGTRQFQYAICGHVHSGQHLPIDYCGCKYVNVSIKDEDYKVKYDLFEFEI